MGDFTRIKNSPPPKKNKNNKKKKNNYGNFAEKKKQKISTPRNRYFGNVLNRGQTFYIVCIGMCTICIVIRTFSI